MSQPKNKEKTVSLTENTNTPKINVTPASTKKILPEDSLIVMLPRKYEFISLTEKIQIPKLSDINSPSDGKKSLSVSKSETEGKCNSSQDSNENAGSVSKSGPKKRKFLQPIAMGGGLSLESSFEKNKEKKTKLTMNRQKVLADTRRLKKEAEILEAEIIQKKHELSADKKESKLEAKIEELEELSDKWKEVTQNALVELQKVLSENSYGSAEIKLSDLIKELKIEPGFIGFNLENEDFES